MSGRAPRSVTTVNGSRRTVLFSQYRHQWETQSNLLNDAYTKLVKSDWLKRSTAKTFYSGNNWIWIFRAGFADAHRVTYEVTLFILWPNSLIFDNVNQSIFTIVFIRATVVYVCYLKSNAVRICDSIFKIKRRRITRVMALYSLSHWLFLFLI